MVALNESNVLLFKRRKIDSVSYYYGTVNSSTLSRTISYSSSFLHVLFLFFIFIFLLRAIIVHRIQYVTMWRQTSSDRQKKKKRFFCPGPMVFGCPMNENANKNTPTLIRPNTLL